MELQRSALEPPAFCDDACAYALRHIGSLLRSLIVQDGRNSV
jgi:hypothetical protein